MIRTQISLSEAQHEFAKQRAEERGISMSAVIREALDAVEGKETEDRATRRARAIDFVRNTPYRDAPDVARNHDDYLAEIYQKRFSG